MNFRLDFGLNPEQFVNKRRFIQYLVFTRLRPFFYVFSSPWKSMFFFVSIFILQCPYPHKPDCHILDKTFPKKKKLKRATVPFWNITLIAHAQYVWTKFSSICSSLLSANANLLFENAEKSAYFFINSFLRTKIPTYYCNFMYFYISLF